MSSLGAPATGSEPWTGCRALVAGFGIPTQRDLDFGRQVVRYLEPLGWPGVVVEELPCAAYLALHRIQELRPRKLVLVGAVQTGARRPGEVRRLRLDQCSGPDLDHTLGVLRQWGALPAETALIEVEPADCGLGLGFSEELGDSLDTILDLIQDELRVEAAAVADEPPGPAPTVDTLAAYADARREARTHERLRGDSGDRSLPGLDVVVRTRAWGIGLESGSDWHDVFPLSDGMVAIVIGEVPGRGVEAAVLKSDLRVATQAYALAGGTSPAGVVGSVDRWTAATGRGEGSTVLYLVLDLRDGDLRLCTAGHCPPLVVAGHGEARFLHDGFTPVIGTGPARTEIRGRLDAGDTLVLFTDGLVEQRNQPLAFGLLQLQEAAAGGPQELDALCDHLLEVCVDRRRREDDVSVVALRRPAV